MASRRAHPAKTRSTKSRAGAKTPARAASGAGRPASAGPDRIDVVVTLDESSRARAPDVVARLKAHGFQLAQSLDAIGVVTGSVPAASLDALGAVKGVASVEEEKTDYRIQ